MIQFQDNSTEREPVAAMRVAGAAGRRRAPGGLAGRKGQRVPGKEWEVSRRKNKP